MLIEVQGVLVRKKNSPHQGWQKSAIITIILKENVCATQLIGLSNAILSPYKLTRASNSFYAYYEHFKTWYLVNS